HDRAEPRRRRRPQHRPGGLLMVLDSQQTANNLVPEHRNNTDFHTLPAIGDFAEASQVQQAYVSKLPGGNDIAGYKIGMTSQRLMEMFGVTHPLAGAILRNRVHPSGVHLDLRNYAHLG